MFPIVRLLKPYLLWDLIFYVFIFDLIYPKHIIIVCWKPWCQCESFHISVVYHYPLKNTCQLTLINCCTTIRTLLPCTWREAEITHFSPQLRGWGKEVVKIQICEHCWSRRPWARKLPPTLGILTLTAIHKI